MPAARQQPLNLLRSTAVGACLVSLVLAAFFVFGVEASSRLYIAVFVAGLVGDSIVQRRAQNKVKGEGADRSGPRHRSP